MIKKAMLIVIIFIFLVSTVVAEISPREISKEFCEIHGHTFEYGNDTPNEDYTFNDYCLFDDGNKCNANEFQKGECGEEYKKELSCAKEGENPRFRGCCEGLYSPPVKGTPAACQKLNFFQKIWYWLTSIF